MKTYKLLGCNCEKQCYISAENAYKACEWYIENMTNTKYVDMIKSSTPSEAFYKCQIITTNTFTSGITHDIILMEVKR